MSDQEGREACAGGSLDVAAGRLDGESARGRRNRPAYLTFVDLDDSGQHSCVAENVIVMNTE